MTNEKDLEREELEEYKNVLKEIREEKGTISSFDSAYASCVVTMIYMFSKGEVDPEDLIDTLLTYTIAFNEVVGEEK